MPSQRITRVAFTFLKFYVPLLAIITLVYFPYETDASAGKATHRGAQGYYDAAYQGNGQQRRAQDYEEVGRQVALTNDTEGVLRGFVKQYGLEDKRVLDVGSGRGYLQDVAHDYTGLDISETVASRYHKPFVVGSATAMPLPDSSFDAIWSIWVLEHIPEPEAALKEMRRMLEPGGVLFLAVAWDCTSWATDGFDVRPYSDFNWRGKVVEGEHPRAPGAPDALASADRRRAVGAISSDGAGHFAAVSPHRAEL
jgi:SAM-dependent methyltransferase